MSEQLFTSPVTYKNNGSSSFNPYRRMFESGGTLRYATAGELEIGITVRQVHPRNLHVAIHPLFVPGQFEMIANGAIAKDAPVYRAANGKVSSSGTSQIGIALETVSSDGDVISVQIAALGGGGGGGPLDDGDKGDITVSTAGTTWTVNAGAVTTPKIANGAVNSTKLDTVFGGGPASFTNTNLTVGADGRITAASSGSGGTGVTVGSKGDINVVGADTDWQINAGAVDTVELANDSVTADKINNEAVTLAKVQHIGTDTLLGRMSTGTGDVEILNAETAVVGALSGATLTPVTVATMDKIIIQDADDADSVKTITAQSIADLVAGGGGNVSNTGAPLDNQIPIWTNATTIEGVSALTFNGTTLNVNGDITLSGDVDGRDVLADGTKLDLIDITQTVDLDQIEIDVATNNAKVSNVTHDGEVTGATTLTITAGAVTTTKILNEAVTVDKIQHVGESTFLGRTSAGTGDVEVLDATTAVVASLNGATLTDVTAATGDFVIVQDASDAKNIKTVTAQSIADLAAGGGITIASVTDTADRATVFPSPIEGDQAWHAAGGTSNGLVFIYKDAAWIPLSLHVPFAMTTLNDLLEGELISNQTVDLIEPTGEVNQYRWEKVATGPDVFAWRIAEGASAGGGGGIANGDYGDIDVTGSGDIWTIKDDAITTDKIFDDAVTTPKINNLAVTSAKMSTTGVTADTYTNPIMDVDVAGRITAITNGAAGGFTRYLGTLSGGDQAASTHASGVTVADINLVILVVSGTGSMVNGVDYIVNGSGVINWSGGAYAGLISNGTSLELFYT